MFSTIVVGTDGSESANAAVAKAGELARMCGGSLHLVFGCGQPAIASASVVGIPVAPVAVEDIQAEFENLARPLREQGIEVGVHVSPVSGPDAVLTAAEELDADLIVVGNRGMSGSRRFLLGSVPNAVSHHAPCSVLIVHTG